MHLNWNLCSFHGTTPKQAFSVEVLKFSLNNSQRKLLLRFIYRNWRRRRQQISKANFTQGIVKYETEKNTTRGITE